jgi:hypothetical protein
MVSETVARSTWRKRVIFKEWLIKFIKFKYSRNFTALKMDVWMARGEIRNIWKVEDATDA